MLLAVAYPILAFLGQWLAGGPLRLAGVQLAPANTVIARIFVVFRIFSSVLIWGLTQIT